MAAKYALAPFAIQIGGVSQFVEQGALRDSASAVVAAAPLMFTTAMTLALSTVPSLNPNPVPVSVTVAGGTVTVIAVSGVVSGLTSGTFTIPPGGSITITYSVAPTTFTMADITPTAATVGALLAGYLAVYSAGP